MKLFKKIFGNWKWMGKPIGEEDPIKYWKKDSATAWNMCEQRRVENNRLNANLLVANKRIRDLERKRQSSSIDFNKALDLLLQGKKKFTPSTTNSDVDEFLKRYGRL